MSKIIPVNITTTEQAVTLDATYQFVWLRNMGENDALLSDHSDIVAGDDNVTLVKAGESGRIATSGRAVYIKTVDGTSTGEIHAQNFSDAPFRNKAKGGGQSITVEPLTVTDNGVYTAPTGKAYSPVSVDVQEEPWQPLEDGYSNFWFELTNDTLSPWLNFSAKTENAVIDWGDGSGEQALTTLTPTHTYSKPGRYIVKCKGVTGIAIQHSAPYQGGYLGILEYIEIGEDITYLSTYAVRYCVGLKEIALNSNITGIPNNFMQYCTQFRKITIPNNITSIGETSFSNCWALKKIILPSSITSIGNSAFQYSMSLSEIHVQATNPPTLGTNAFVGLPTNYIIYVPVGTGDTYKAASGWSTYADHILEEGQQPNRMMLAKFNSAKTDEPQDDMR